MGKTDNRIIKRERIRSRLVAVSVLGGVANNYKTDEQLQQLVTAVKNFVRYDLEDLF